MKRCTLFGVVLLGLTWASEARTESPPPPACQVSVLDDEGLPDCLYVWGLDANPYDEGSVEYCDWPIRVENACAETATFQEVDCDACADWADVTPGQTRTVTFPKALDLEVGEFTVIFVDWSMGEGAGVLELEGRRYEDHQWSSTPASGCQAVAVGPAWHVLGLLGLFAVCVRRPFRAPSS